MSSTTLHNTVPDTAEQDQTPLTAPVIIRERRGLALCADNRVYLFDAVIQALKPGQQPGYLVALLDDAMSRMDHVAHVSLVDTGDLLYVLTGQQEITPNQQDEWLQTYVQARSAFVGLTDQLVLTSTGRVLPHRFGGQEFLDTLMAAKEALKDLPIDIQQGTALYGACLVTSHIMTSVVIAYNRACLTTWLMSISGGTLFIRAIEDLRTVAQRLPSLPVEGQGEPSVVVQYASLPASALPEPSLSPIEQELFVEQSKSRADEIQRDKESRRTLLLKLLEYAGIFLSIGLANVSNTGAISLAYPIIALFLMVEWRRDNDKIGLNRRFTRNRIERVIYRTNLPWEIYRAIISKLVGLLREAQKARKQATFAQLVQVIEPQAREILTLAPSEGIPDDILTEMEFAFQAPANLLEFATRGVALFMQFLTLIVGIASVVIHLLQTPASPQAWVIAGIAALFVAADGYAIFQTWKIIKHVR